MPASILPSDLASNLSEWTVIDVRKQKARLAATETIAGCHYRSPFSADSWWSEFRGHRVAVFCVHGHEVSQAVCGFLADQDIDARFISGGFEGWVRASLPVQSIGGGDR
jgi:rhodanese-related sulfurtransferase